MLFNGFCLNVLRPSQPVEIYDYSRDEIQVVQLHVDSHGS